jgi:hypothetical protein
METLIERLTRQLKILRAMKLNEGAGVLEWCINEVAATLEAHKLELLTYAEAAEESGYSYSAIEKSVRNGDIPNYGSKGKPRVRRGDLPRKAARGEGIADRVLKLA